MKKFLKNSEGFTLVELMVVVAIIGILSAIAVPNFKKYQAKSKQSEAKIQLAALYSAEVGTNADWDTYATCLALMGYEQPPRGYYIVGFKTPYDATAVSSFTNCTAAAVAAIAPVTANHLAAVNANKPTVISFATAGSTQNTFTASAEGSISVAVTLDIWTIDETKKLTNSTPGY